MKKGHDGDSKPVNRQNTEAPKQPGVKPDTRRSDAHGGDGHRHVEQHSTVLVIPREFWRRIDVEYWDQISRQIRDRIEAFAEDPPEAEPMNGYPLLAAPPAGYYQWCKDANGNEYWCYCEKIYDPDKGWITRCIRVPTR